MRPWCLLLVTLVALGAGAAEVVVEIDWSLERLTVTECRSGCRSATQDLAPDGSRVLAFGADRLLDGATWLRRLPRPVDVRFVLPAGIEVSSPGLPLDAGGTRYRLGAHPGGWPAVLAFGRFRQREVAVGDARRDARRGDAPRNYTRLDVAVLDGEPAPDVEVLTDWVAEAARRVTRVYGAFPVPRVQVVVTPVAGRASRRPARGSDPVPFGRVLRDGGEGVQFFVRQTASAAELDRDWTATHEFSHLLLPFVERGDGWISEGFATYYQNVLLARAGVYDEREAWQRLVDGFRRGRRDDYRDTLEESIAHDGENHVMRMYWSGAAIALLADVELRMARSSLDALLSRLRDQLPSAEAWSAERVMTALDAAGGGGRLEALRRRWTRVPEFPDVAGTLRALGVHESGGRVTLDDAAALAALRRDIMRGAPASAGPAARHDAGVQ